MCKDGDLGDHIFITDLKMNGLTFPGVFSYIDKDIVYLVIDDGTTGREIHIEELGFKYCPMCGRKLEESNEKRQN